MVLVGIGWSDTLKIKRVEFSGNRHLKNLSKLTTLKTRSSLDSSLIKSDQNSIKEKYAKEGFIWTEVNYHIIPQSDGLILQWQIKENNQAQIGKIEIIGNKNSNDSTLLPQLKFTKGVFTQKTVEANIATLLQTYLDSGYALCKIEPKNFQIADSKVSYTLKVNQGPKVVVATVEFSSQLTTKPEVLRRIVNLGSNWLYSETKSKAGLRRLEKTNLFNVISYDIKEQNGEYFLLIQITEKKSNEIQAAFAFLPKTQDRATEYSGFALINLKNILGTLRQMNVSWSRNTLQTNYNLFYIEPFLFGLGMTLGGGINHETRDTTYAKTNFNLFTDIAVQDNLGLRFETGYELVIPGVTGFERTQTYWAGNGISFDSRNRPTNPQRGIYANLTNRIGQKLIKYQAAQLVAKTFFDSEMVLPFSDKLNLTFLLHGRNIYASDTVTLYDSLYLGGASSLRGYPEQAFSSTRIFWLNNELRWLLANQSRIFPFFDIGAFLNEDNSYEIKTGYGLGIRVWSRIGLFGIDYGLSFGENPLNGKVHLTLTSQF